MDAEIEDGNEEQSGLETLLYVIVGVLAVAYIGVLIAIRYLRGKAAPTVEPTPQARRASLVYGISLYFPSAIATGTRLCDVSDAHRADRSRTGFPA